LGQSTARRILLQTMELDNSIILAQQVETTLGYQIIRQQDGAPVTLPATEASVLQPGDLVKVTVVEVSPGEPADTAALASNQ
jgi:hypothetical protein